MEKSPSKNLKRKNLIEGLMKLCLYLLMFFAFIFVFLSVASYLWLGSYEIEMDELLSAPLKEFPLK